MTGLITGEQVAQAVAAARIHAIPHHDCSICGEWVFYFVEQGNLFFDSNCGCSSYSSVPQQTTWEDAADWINMQTNQAAKFEIMSRFGL